MADATGIEWTDRTWNPIAGCTMLSPGCSNCYAERTAARCEALGHTKYIGTTKRVSERIRWSGRISVDRKALLAPYGWTVGQKVFVNSMSDLFHENISAAIIRDIWRVMVGTPRHCYQVLTKRADRLLDLSPTLVWPEHIWMGVSIENEDYLWRADRLNQTGACVKFLSLEPLLGPLPNLDLSGIDWVIVGGESGPGARPMNPDWVRAIRDLTVAAGVAFHFKQWGGVKKAVTGRLLDGRTWDEYPGEVRRNVISQRVENISV